MSSPRMRQEQLFWHIVKDLRWKLDDGNNGFPAGEPEFGFRPNRPAIAMWVTHVAAFLLGAVAFGLLLVAPAVVPALALGALAALAVTYRRLHG